MVLVSELMFGLGVAPLVFVDIRPTRALDLSPSHHKQASCLLGSRGICLAEIRMSWWMQSESASQSEKSILLRGPGIMLLPVKQD